MEQEKLEKFKKFAGSWDFEMQSDNVEEVLAAQGSYQKSTDRLVHPSPRTN